MAHRILPRARSASRPQVCANGATFKTEGATFDLTPLMRTGDTPDFMVTDGDIPCTTTVEQNCACCLCRALAHAP